MITGLCCWTFPPTLSWFSSFSWYVATTLLSVCNTNTGHGKLWWAGLYADIFIYTSSFCCKVATSWWSLKSCQPVFCMSGGGLLWSGSAIVCWLRPESLFLAASGDWQRIPFYMNVEARTNGLQTVEQTNKKTPTKMKKRGEVTNLGVCQLNMNRNEGNDGQDGEGRSLSGEQRW